MMNLRTKKSKIILSVIAIVIVVAMTLAMILPYLVR